MMKEIEKYNEIDCKCLWEIIRYLRDKGYHMLSSDKECDIIVIHQSSKFCPPYSKAYEF